MSDSEKLDRILAKLDTCNEKIDNNFLLLSNQIKGVVNDVENLKIKVNEIDDIKNKVDTNIPAKIKELESSIKRITMEQEANRQYMRSNNLEISSLDLDNNINLYYLIERIGQHYDLEIGDKDIDIVHLSKSKKSVIVKFINRWVKKEIWERSRSRRVNSQQLGLPGPTKNVFIDDHLTYEQKLLFKRARVLKKAGFHKVALARGAKIVIKVNEDSSFQKVETESDIAEYERLASEMCPEFVPFQRA